MRRQSVTATAIAAAVWPAITTSVRQSREANATATEIAVVLPVMATFARILWKASVTVTGIVTAAAVLVESVPLRAANATVTAIVVGLPA